MFNATEWEIDGKISRYKKVSFFDNTPTLKWCALVQDLLGNLLRTKLLVTFGGFHGSESLLVDFMRKYILCNGRTKC